MIRVAIETSTRVGSVAVGRDGKVLARVELGEQTRHASRLVPALDEALAAAGVARGAIAAVVVGAGPGSFTGVRVAGATAKGLTTALGVPLVAYSSLLGLAVQAAELGADGSGGAADAAGLDAAAGAGPVCGLFDARRGEVYGGCWALDGGRELTELVAPMVGGVADVVDALVRAGAGAGAGSGVTFVGEGVRAYGSALEAASAAAGIEARLAAPGAGPSAAALLWLAHWHPAVGRVADAAAWEPLYVRGSSAERGIRG